MAKPKPKTAKPKAAAKPKAKTAVKAKTAAKPKAATKPKAKAKHHVVVVAQQGEGILGSVFPFLGAIGL